MQRTFEEPPFLRMGVFIGMYICLQVLYRTLKQTRFQITILQESKMNLQGGKSLFQMQSKSFYCMDVYILQGSMYNPTKLEPFEEPNIPYLQKELLVLESNICFLGCLYCMLKGSMQKLIILNYTRIPILRVQQVSPVMCYMLNGSVQNPKTF